MTNIKTIEEIDADLLALQRQISTYNRLIKNPTVGMAERVHFATQAILAGAQKDALHVLRAELYNKVSH